MKIKNGYIVNKTVHRRDVVDLPVGKYTIKPYYEEGKTFLNATGDDVEVILPNATVGRMHTFRSTGSGSTITITPQATDTILTASLSAGGSLVNTGVGEITLVCHVDTKWMVDNVIGAWAEVQ